MAGSLLLAVDSGARVLEPIKKLAGSLALGSSMGALIDRAARQRLVSAIERAESAGVQIALDGRSAKVPAAYGGGNWLGPTILDQVTPDMDCAKEELFGPVLAVVRVPTLDGAVELSIEKDRLIVRSTRRPIRLDELLARITPDNLPESFDDQAHGEEAL